MALLYNAGLWASLPPSGPEPPRGVLENPDAPIGDILLPQASSTSTSPSGSSPSSSTPSARLPLITLPARRAPPRRIRSFGDLGSADNLPDMGAVAAAISIDGNKKKKGMKRGMTRAGKSTNDFARVAADAAAAAGASPAPPASSPPAPTLHHSASSPALMRGRGSFEGSLPVAPTTPLAAAAAAAAAASAFSNVDAARRERLLAAATAFASRDDDEGDDDSLSSSSGDDDALVPGGKSGVNLACSSSAATTDYSSADMQDEEDRRGSWSSEDDAMVVDGDDEGKGAKKAQSGRPPLPPLPPRSAAAPKTIAAAPSTKHQQQQRPAPPPRPRRALPPAAKPSLIDRVLLSEWADRASAGLFRYDVTGLPTRLLLAPDGRGGGFVAQFNEGRLTKKRPTEFSQDAVVQPFDADKFNFLKAAQKEVLFALSRDGAPGTTATWSPEGAPCGPDPSLLLINVSPIEYGHVLLIPRVASRLPQLVDAESAALALRFAAEADNPYLRLCYNSLGAFGTVNHLHFQAYFLATPFAVEVAATAPLPPLLPPSPAASTAPGKFGAVAVQSLNAPRVSTTVGYPARALVFEATRGDLDGLAQALGDACSRLAANNVPHNVFVVDCGQRAFLFPNVFGRHKAEGKVSEDLLDTQVDPACFELAGHMVFKRREDFYDLSEGAAYELVWKLLAAATPEPEEFARIVRIALAI